MSKKFICQSCKAVNFHAWNCKSKFLVVNCPSCKKAKKRELYAGSLSGGKRMNLAVFDDVDGYWEIFGKDDSCKASGSWKEIVILAAKILAHPNTSKIIPDLYKPEFNLIVEASL